VWQGEPGGGGVGTYVYPGVENAVINGTLHQDLSYGDTHPEGTLVLGNDIDVEGGFLGVGFATRSSHAFASKNTVFGGEFGLGVLGWDDAGVFYEPGTCSGDPKMYCSAYPEDRSSSCNLRGIGPRGTCKGGQAVVGGGRVIAPTFVDNTVSGANYGLMGGWTAGFRAEGNNLLDGGVGIYLWGYVLDSSSIRGNVASGNEIGLQIEDDNYNGVAVPGLELSYNDLGDNAAPFDAYTLEFWRGRLRDVTPYVKSTVMPGNWWGESCGVPEGAWWPNTDDPSPAAAPIAEAWRKGREDRVARCPQRR
jgi:hypothetical protein